MCVVASYLRATFGWQPCPQPPQREQGTHKKEDKAATGQHYRNLKPKVLKASGAAVLVIPSPPPKKILKNSWCIIWTLTYIALSSLKLPPNQHQIITFQWETTCLLEDTKSSSTFGQSLLLFVWHHIIHRVFKHERRWLPPGTRAPASALCVIHREPRWTSRCFTALLWRAPFLLLSSSY